MPLGTESVVIVGEPALGLQPPLPAALIATQAMSLLAVMAIHTLLVRIGLLN